MDMTSAAEAKLDARIRPQVSALRLATLSAGQGPAATSPAAAAARSVPRRTPVRLTRRGRIVVGVLLAIVVAAMTSLIWLAVAGQADASSHAGPTLSLRGSMSRVVVKPGQTLWGIATKADPSADPRVIIPQIMTINELSGTAIEAGQVLWVPRD
jgi:predicted metal-binding membrane protein